MLRGRCRDLLCFWLPSLSFSLSLSLYLSLSLSLSSRSLSLSIRLSIPLSCSFLLFLSIYPFCLSQRLFMVSVAHFASLSVCLSACLQQTRVYPYPLGTGSARPNPKMGASDPENPAFLGLSVLRGGLRPWSRKDHGVGVEPETAAFLYASLPEGQDVYCRPPNVLVRLGLFQPGNVWKLKKAPYDLRTSPKAWEE